MINEIPENIDIHARNFLPILDITLNERDSSLAEVS